MRKVYNIGSSPVARGVRKVNERLVQEGRALIITEHNLDLYNWNDIPDGSLYVSGRTGLIQIKLEGQSGWVPANLRIDIPRNTDGEPLGTDGTVVSLSEAYQQYGQSMNATEVAGTVGIAKDSIVIQENFTITSINKTEGIFTYENEYGESRTRTINNEGFWFDIEKSTYPPGRNMLEVIIDDCLFRSARTGGIIEKSERTFVMPEQLELGMELTVKYIKVFRYGNPYPRIFLHDGRYNELGVDRSQPEMAEYGDLWLDFNSELETDTYLGENIDKDHYVPWDRIVNFPTNVDDARGLGFMLDVSKEGHTHSLYDLTDWDGTARANGGRADYADVSGKATISDLSNSSLTLQNRTIGSNAGDIPILDINGQIPGSQIGNHTHTVADITDLSAAILNTLPVGTMIMYMCDGDIPRELSDTWVECISDQTIGTVHVPNMSGRFPVGIGSSFCTCNSNPSQISDRKYQLAHKYNPQLPNLWGGISNFIVFDGCLDDDGSPLNKERGGEIKKNGWVYSSLLDGIRTGSEGGRTNRHLWFAYNGEPEQDRVDSQNYTPKLQFDVSKRNSQYTGGDWMIFNAHNYCDIYSDTCNDVQPACVGVRFLVKIR